MIVLTIDEKAKRYDEIVRYMSHWPYSPYDSIEYRALSSTIKEIIKRPV